MWRHDVLRWQDYVPRSGLLTKHVDALLQPALLRAQAAYEAREVDGLAELLPPEEHWRLFGEFAEQAAYLDIETSDDAVGAGFLSAIGVLDRNGPRLLLAGPDLQSFPELARGWSMLVTFNGSSFDLPILRRVFPEWQPPRAHVDLRHVLRRLGYSGGLKAIERRVPLLHLARPDHLDGLDAGRACGLFTLGRNGDRAALRRFAEYNLYDVINLRTLMAYAYNALVEAHASRVPGLRHGAPAVPIPGRGDVLYDVSKILLAL